MVELIVRLVVGTALAIVGWVVFLPLMFVVYTPVALVLSLWRGRRYGHNLQGEYRRLWRFWKEWGVPMVPPW